MSVWIAEEKPTRFISTKYSYDINIKNLEFVDALNTNFSKYFYMNMLLKAITISSFKQTVLTILK